jgi:hypothetical protein
MDTFENQNEFSNDAFAWQAPEFKHYEKNSGWYITLVAIAVLVVGFQIFQKDYFGALSLALIAAFIAGFANSKPKMVNIRINDKGIYIDSLFLPHKTIRHFWMVNNPDHKTLNLETTTYLNRTVILELMDEDSEEIRAFLVKYIPEHENTEATWSQRIRHRLRF